jgi:hypothetical protein
MRNLDSILRSASRDVYSTAMGRREKDKDREHRKQRDWEAEEDTNSEECSQFGEVWDPPRLDDVAVSESADNSGQGYESFSDGLEMLSEKKANSRLKGLQQILQVLQNGGAETFPPTSLEALRTCLAKFLRRPASPTEGIEAAKVLSVLSLVLGPNDELVESFTPILIQLITRVEDEHFRMEVLKSFAFLSYVSSTNRSESPAWILCEEFVLQTAEGLPAPDALRWTALKFWCLLASVIDSDVVLDHSRDGVFEAAIEILEDADTEGKVIAGESLAFLWEVAYDQNEEGDSSSWQAVLCSNVRECERAIGLLTRIGRDSSKRIAKKEKKERKGAMRMALDWITEGVAPEESLELRGTVLEITTFSSLQQVAILREVLGDGFQGCLKSFPSTRCPLPLSFALSPSCSSPHPETFWRWSTSLSRS